MENNGYERHLKSVRAQLKAQMVAYRECIEESFPMGTKMSQPRGGLALWLELPNGLKALDLYRAAIREHISFYIGSLFSPAEDYESHLRIGFGGELTEKMERALRRLGELSCGL